MNRLKDAKEAFEKVATPCYLSGSRQGLKLEPENKSLKDGLESVSKQQKESADEGTVDSLQWVSLSESIFLLRRCFVYELLTARCERLECCFFGP